MAEDPTYDIPLEAEQISTALQQVHAADTVPTTDSDKMVRSGAVAQAIATETSARSAADTALDGRITALEDVPPPSAAYTLASGNRYSTGNLTGYTADDPDNITSESSGVVTITSSGTYLVTFFGEYNETDYSSDRFKVQYHIGGNTRAEIFVDETRLGSTAKYPALSYATPLKVSGTETLSIYAAEHPQTTLNYRRVEIRILKLS